MFYQLLYIHLFRPFLKYRQDSSPLPINPTPRRYCTQAAAMISKLLRLYKRTYGFRHICNIAVYIAHSACTIHLLNLPEKNACRDIIHGLKHLEEIADSWLCTRRTLAILDTVARRWKITLPEEATRILLRTKAKFGIHLHKQESPRSIDAVFMAPESSPLPDKMNQKPSPSFSVPADGLLLGTIPRISPMAMSKLPNGGVMPFPGQSTVEVESKPLQQHYALSPAQPELWRTNVAQDSVAPTESSPSMVFGGVESLVEENRDWWLEDQANFFDNWYGSDQEAALLGNSNTGNSSMRNSSVNGFGNLSFGPNPYGMSGKNGFETTNRIS